MSADRDVSDAQESGLDNPEQLDRRDIANTQESGLDEPEQLDRRDIADTQESGSDEPEQLDRRDVADTQESGSDGPEQLVDGQLLPEIKEILFQDEIGSPLPESPPPTDATPRPVDRGRTVGIVYERDDPFSLSEVQSNPSDHESNTNVIDSSSSEDTDQEPEEFVVDAVVMDEPSSMQTLMAQIQERLQHLQERINDTQNNNHIPIAESQLFDYVSFDSEVANLRNMSQALLAVEDRQQRIEDRLHGVNHSPTRVRSVSVILFSVLLLGCALSWSLRTFDAQRSKAPVCEVMKLIKDFPDFPDNTSAEDVIRSIALFDGSEFAETDSPQSKALAWISNSSVQRSPLRTIQRYSLACLYYSTSLNSTSLKVSNSANMSRWRRADGWLQESHECSWYNVACEDEVVSGLKLALNGLMGTLPAELILLRSSLVVLEVKKNPHLVGTVPCFLGALSRLAVLDAEACSLEGILPTELGLLEDSLENLDLASNQLNGTIPTEIGALTVLEQLHIQLNYLSGTIPTEIGNMVKLQDMRLQYNELEGPLPKAICDHVKEYHPAIGADCGNCDSTRDCCATCYM